MSSTTTLGQYQFEAWARRGIAASLNNPDNGALPSRASLSVQLFLDVQGGSTPNPVQVPATTVNVFGPGDVVGIDQRMVIRTEPRPFTVNFEPNYLCGIEFDTPDFPWLFTPAAPNGDRLHPWVALIVLKQGNEFTLPSTAPNPLPTVVVNSMAALQDLSASWNWAHVQISGNASLSDSLAAAPGNVISRLLCPRRLDPQTSYTAFLVPAFQNGVQAGLGNDVSSLTTSDPAWTQNTQAPLTLPYYFRFDFNTSDQGDFESLVRALTPRVLPATVGQRPMAVSPPNPSIPVGGPLPPGLALDALTGAITGTPTAVGVYNFIAQVVDATNTAAGTTLASFSIVVGPLPVTLSAPNPTAQSGTAYNSTLAVTGGTAPYTFAIINGSLPPGLTLNASTGTISGTPTSAGTYNFTVQLVDSTETTPNTMTVSFSIVVGPLAIALSPPMATAEVGAAYNSMLAATGGTAPYTFSIVSTALGLDGALESISTTDTQWTGPGKDAFQSTLQNWVNQTSPATDDPAHPNPTDPVVVPPIYGRWQAAVASVNRAASGWVNDLNLDPRNRAPAGLGTQVVQTEQTQLMASAWQQVEGVLAANQMLRQAQLARSVSQQLYRQHLQIAQTETLFNVTAPLHSKLLTSPTTVTAQMRASRVPPRMFSGAFRKVARLRGRLHLAQNGAPTLLSRVNSGAVTIVPPIQPPAGMVSVDQISDQSAPSWAETAVKWWKWILIGLIVMLAAMVVIVGFTAGWAAALVAAVAGVGIAVGVWNYLKNTIASAQAANQVQFSNFTTASVAQVPPRPGFQVMPAGTPLPASSATGTDSAQAAAFRSAASQLFGDYQALPMNPGPLPSLDLATLQKTILKRIDPVTTVPARIQGLLTLAPNLPWHPLDPLEPIMAAPSFPQPMYAPLRDLSQAYLLPGVDQIPPNTLGLLQSNRTFIEAYMVGLNSEMGSELLWFGYPTDQRGSYFRQFWDVSSYVPQPGDPGPTQLAALLKDIPPINTWPLNTSLGQHPNRSDIVQNNLVLLVRGELFKRYPNAIVYAGKAKRLPDGTLVLDDTDERYPIFRGTLSPDMTFLGFNLTAADAQGGTPASPYGFFFVFQEQPSEPRFGLEPTPDVSPVPHWADLAWTNFALPNNKNTPRRALTMSQSPATLISKSPWRVASQAFASVLQSTQLPDFLSPGQQPTGIAIVDDANDPNDTDNNWGVNSAQTAYILLRLPFRILIQASLMLPQP